MTCVIILAGGLGTRLRSAVSDRPKPMALIQNTPFLEHLMNYFCDQGATKFVLSVGFMATSIQKYFGSSFCGRKISYAIEDTPRGSGGGLLNAIDFVKGDSPIVVANGDTFFPIKLSTLEIFHQEKTANITIALFPSTESERFGAVTVDSESRILGIEESKCRVGELGIGGIYIMSPQCLRYAKSIVKMPTPLESGIVQLLINQKYSVFGKKFDSPFIDIGFPRDYARAQEINFNKQTNTEMHK